MPEKPPRIAPEPITPVKPTPEAVVPKVEAEAAPPAKVEKPPVVDTLVAGVR